MPKDRTLRVSVQKAVLAYYCTRKTWLIAYRVGPVTDRSVFHQPSAVHIKTVLAIVLIVAAAMVGRLQLHSRGFVHHVTCLTLAGGVLLVAVGLLSTLKHSGTYHTLKAAGASTSQMLPYEQQLAHEFAVHLTDNVTVSSARALGKRLPSTPFVSGTGSLKYRDY